MSEIILDLNDPAGLLPEGCENQIKAYLARALELNRVPRAAACLSAVDGQEIRRLNREDGISVMMITHDVSVALREATHVLHAGENVFFGTREDYLCSPLARRFLIQEGGASA